MSKKIEDIGRSVGLNMDPVLPGGFPNEQQLMALEFARSIAESCASICDGIAADARQIADGSFVTPAGRAIHEGMFGGAMGCAASIRHRFDVNPDQVKPSMSTNFLCWFNELEGFALRSERFYDDMGNHKGDLPELAKKMVAWLEAAYEAGASAPKAGQKNEQ